MKTKFLALATLALTLAACNNDNENNPQPTARFTAEIDGATLTRAAGTGWDQNDPIGITATGNTAMSQYANVKYITTNGDGNFTGSPIYFQNNQNVTFTAYYPFDGTEGTAAGKLNNNTRTQTTEHQKKIDYLFAEAKDKNCNNADVAFTFYHKMSQITITFIAGNDISFSDTEISYSLNGLNMTGEFDTSNGTAQATGTTTEALTIGNVTLASSPATVAPVILYPQSAASVTLTVTLDGQNYSCELDIEDNELKAENNYTFDITVSKTGLNVQTSGIEGWNPIEGSGTAQM